jgi:hypothetical protein
LHIATILPSCGFTVCECHPGLETPSRVDRCKPVFHEYLCLERESRQTKTVSLCERQKKEKEIKRQGGREEGETHPQKHTHIHTPHTPPYSS